MLRITIELIPHGCEAAKHVIAKGEVINDASGNSKTGNYLYSFCPVASRTHPASDVVHGSVRGFDRGRGALQLLMETLKDAYEE